MSDPHSSAPPPSQGPAVAPLDPPEPARCAAPVCFNARGEVVEDARALLELPAEGALEPEAVRAAWARQLQAHPPEREPELASALREARDRLLDPERFLERVAGALRVPDADAWGLPALDDDDAAGDAADANDAAADAPPPAATHASARERLLAELIVYALVEDALLDALD